MKDEIWQEVTALVDTTPHISSFKEKVFKVAKVSQIPCDKKTKVEVKSILDSEIHTVAPDALYSLKNFPLQELSRIALQGSTGENEEKDSTVEHFFCVTCKNNSSRKCKDCGCFVCGGKEDEAETLLCEECQMYFHMKCLKPKLTKVPEGDW
jgi:hypothetical protein